MKFNQREAAEKAQQTLKKAERQQAAARREAERKLDDLERTANAFVNKEFLTEEERLLSGKLSNEEYAKSSFLRDAAKEKMLKKESDSAIP